MPVLSLLLAATGSVFILLNWGCLFASIFTRKYHSMVPPLGGILLTGGLLLNPSLFKFAWIGLLLDCGFWALLAAVPMFIKEATKHSKSKLVAELSGKFADVSVRIRLYRPDHYVVNLDHTLLPGVTGWSKRGSFGTWKETSGRLVLVSHTDKEELPAKAVFSWREDLDSYETTDSTYREARDAYTAPEFPPIGCRLRLSTG